MYYSKWRSKLEEHNTLPKLNSSNAIQMIAALQLYNWWGNVSCIFKSQIKNKKDRKAFKQGSSSGSNGFLVKIFGNFSNRNNHECQYIPLEDCSLNIYIVHKLQCGCHIWCVKWFKNVFILSIDKIWFLVEKNFTQF